MKKLAFLSAFILSLSVLVNAQSLGIDSLSTAQYPDSSQYNSTSQILVNVLHKGGAPYSGTIYLVCSVDSGNSFLIDTVGTSVVNSFSAGDTTTISFNETFNNLNGFKIGGNIVVIWPIAANASTLDSLNKTVYVYNLNSLDKDPYLKNLITVYPNPASDILHVDLNAVNNTVKQVRIYNLSGKVVSDYFNTKTIRLNNLAKGTYTVSITLSNKSVVNYQLIKK